MAINAFFPCNYRYPYTNDHELNLGWVLATIKAQESELSKFVALNTVKYADPFDWNITSQYATNTVVFNPADMTAYISVHPVPSGVQIDNTDYWTPIFTLADIFTAYKTSITPVEQIAAKPATHAISKGQLLWIDNVLYQAVRDIAQGTVIVPGENVLLTNISDELAAHEAAITAEQEDRVQADTQLQASITTEQSAREQADTQLHANITAEQTAREEADTELQKQIGNISETYFNVKNYGAVGDGETIDSAAISDCLSANAGKRIYFPSGTYLINAPITLPDHTSLIGDGDSTIIKAASGFNGTCMLQTRMWSPDSVVNDDYGYVSLAHIAFDGSYKTDYTSTSETGSGSWDGLHIGGIGPVLDHVSVYNMPCTGISLSDNRTYGYAFPRGEPLFSNVTSKYNGNHGLFVMNGSHDGEYVNCIIASNSRAVTNTYHNLAFSENNANGRFTNCHFYSDYGEFKPAFSVHIPSGAAPSRFTNCDIEGAANANIHCGASGTTLVNCHIYATFGAALVYIDQPCMFVGCLFGKQAEDSVPSSKPSFAQIATFRNITSTPLNNVAFINCRVMQSNVPMVSYQPGSNASNWIFDINGESNVNPLNTSSIPATWKVRWCGSFPTPIYEDTNT